MGPLGSKRDAALGAASGRRGARLTAGGEGTGRTDRLFSRRETRALDRSFRAIEQEVRAEHDASVLCSLAGLADRRERVARVTSSSYNPSVSRVEVALACEDGSRVVLQSVPVNQAAEVADSCAGGDVRVVHAARPGSLYVVCLETARGTCQLVGSHAAVGPAPPGT